MSGKSILVWTEQGLGDEILFASMLPDVIARAAHCIIECSPRLAPVLARSFPDAKVVPYQSADVSVTPAHGITYQAAIGDLGRFLRADAAAFPGQRGYLKADMARSQILRARYRALKPGNLIVGISWRSTNADIGALKTAPLSEWGPLLRVPGVTFVNLQYGDCDSDLGDAKARIGVEIFQDVEINPMKSMDDFFAQVAAMDLVISTSNTTVHVAGSMNVPVWLLDAGGLWYWFRQREDSPWYPSLTIFRSHFQWVAGEGQAWWRPGMDGAACRLAMLAGGEKP